MKDEEIWQDMKSAFKKLLEYFIPQRIALQLGSRNTCLIDEDSNIDHLQTIVFEEGELHSGKYLRVGSLQIHTEVESRFLWPICRREVCNVEVSSFFFKDIFSRRFRFKPLHIYSSVSPDTTEVDFRGLVDAVLSCKQVKKASFIFEPIAAAIGMGLDIEKESYILDIGHTSSIFSVISDNRVRNAHAIYSPCLSDDLLYELKRVMMENNIRVSEAMLGRIPWVIKDEDKYTVHGTNSVTALPMQFTITRKQVIACYSPMIMNIIDKVKDFMKEKDLLFSAESPLYLIGGGSYLVGIAEIFAEQGINVVIPEDSDEVIAKGLHKIAMNKCDYPIDRDKIIFREVKCFKKVRDARRLLPLRD